MITDKELAALVAAQYAGDAASFDHTFSTVGVDYAIKFCPGFTVVCFEGSHDIPDWERDFTFDMVNVPNIGGVERGFHQGLPEVAKQAIPLLPASQPIYVIGHSLGAAEAHIFARYLIVAGYPPESVIRVVWGSPHPGNDIFTTGLVGSPCRSYRNYRSALEQDFVCLVPERLPGLRYEHPGDYVMIDIPAAPHDPWLLLARHHFFLYQQGTP